MSASGAVGVSIRSIPDQFGNSLNAIAGCFLELYEAESSEEADQAYQDGVKSIAILYDALKDYYGSVSKPTSSIAE